MEIVRYWMAADGTPHREVAQLIKVGPNNPRGATFDMATIEGEASGSLPAGRMRVVTVADPAVERGSLTANMNALYALPLRAGARLVDAATWAAATETVRQAERQAATQVSEALEARRAAAAEAERAELMAGLGVTDAQIAAAVAAYMALNPPSGPSTQQIAAAVAAHLQAFPPPPGRAPTQDELLAAVTLYVAANADRLRGPTGATGATGPAGAPADPTQVANLQTQLALLMASYNAGMEVRVEQVTIPTLAVGAQPVTRSVAWTPAFGTGRTVVADAYADSLVGKATLEVTSASTTEATVRITPSAVALAVTTGIVVGISRKAAS